MALASDGAPSRLLQAWWNGLDFQNGIGSTADLAGWKNAISTIEVPAQTFSIFFERDLMLLVRGDVKA